MRSGCLITVYGQRTITHTEIEELWLTLDKYIGALKQDMLNSFNGYCIEHGISIHWYDDLVFTVYHDAAEDEWRIACRGGGYTEDAKSAGIISITI